MDNQKKQEISDYWKSVEAVVDYFNEADARPKAEPWHCDEFESLVLAMNKQAQKQELDAISSKKCWKLLDSDKNNMAQVSAKIIDCARHPEWHPIITLREIVKATRSQ